MLKSCFYQLQTVYLHSLYERIIISPMQKRISIFLIFTVFVLTEVFATHQRAAEITYRWLGGFTYEFTITMYTYTPSPAADDRVFLPIKW